MTILLADLILLLHIAVVAFVVLGQLLFMLGGALHWAWVRKGWLRLAHLLLIAYVALQGWLGLTCPLTVWEQALRRAAGQGSYGESFIEHWLSRLIFYSGPPWVFVTAYTLFAVLVALTWWRVPPQWSAPVSPAVRK